MLQHELFRQPAPGEPMVLAVFSFRYDAHLVPGLLENLRPGLHGYVAWDDRTAADALSDETRRRTRLIEAARALGALWLLAADPDERYERGIADWLPPLVAGDPATLWSFDLREMFAPDRYRVDGLWGEKSVMRLFPMAAAGVNPDEALHGNWVADEGSWQRRRARVNLYHLRMATPERRALRRDLYAAADPDRRFQKLGYDYLTDDRGMELEPIPPERGFDPPFVEDHGLWSPDPGALGEIRPDPYEVRLVRATRMAVRRGNLAAHHVFEDLYRDSPQDHDLRLLAARAALLAGAFDRAAALASDVLRLRAGDLLARLLRAEALIFSGQSPAAAADLAALADLAPGSPTVAALMAEAARQEADFAAPDAAWRFGAPKDAVLHEGRDVARADLATIVIGFQSQPGLLAAVRSLLAQDEASEIVVVNSGGGAVAQDLAPVADRIRLITCETPLFVGAARNIGVAASRAPFVAFLAGDCQARPGWVAGRLQRHRGGAVAVSSAIAVPEDASFLAQVAQALTYSGRSPTTPLRLVQHYGQSHARWHLRHCGSFPPGLRVAEDTVLNLRSGKIVAPVWAPEVQTTHSDPPTLAGMVADARKRGQRRVATPQLRAAAATEEAARLAERLTAQRQTAVDQVAARETRLGPAGQRALRATAWLVGLADLRGMVEGLETLARASRLSAASASEADPAAALALAEAAFAEDPQDAAKALRLGHHRLALGDTAGAEAAFRATLDLAPADVPAARALIDLVARLRGPQAAMAEAERLALAAPASAGLWSLAADRASRAEQAAWAVALAQIALSCAADSSSGHRRVARLHGRAGDPMAEAFRALAARRLDIAAKTG